MGYEEIFICYRKNIFKQKAHLVTKCDIRFNENLNSNQFSRNGWFWKKQDDSLLENNSVIFYVMNKNWFINLNKIHLLFLYNNFNNIYFMFKFVIMFSVHFGELYQNFYTVSHFSVSLQLQKAMLREQNNCWQFRLIENTHIYPKLSEVYCLNCYINRTWALDMYSTSYVVPFWYL